MKFYNVKTSKEVNVPSPDFYRLENGRFMAKAVAPDGTKLTKFVSEDDVRAAGKNPVTLPVWKSSGKKSSGKRRSSSKRRSSAAKKGGSKNGGVSGGKKRRSSAAKKRGGRK